MSFTKGCYPGQEVVARSHYRGTVKRRMAYGRAEAGAQEGALANVDVYDAAQPDEPVGRVIDAARHAGSVSALFEIALAALPGDLRLGAADGPRIAAPLPLFHSARVNALQTSACRTLAERAPAKRAPASESVEGNQWKLLDGHAEHGAHAGRNRHGQRAQDRDAQGGRPLGRAAGAGGQRPQRGQTGDETHPSRSRSTVRSA